MLNDKIKSLIELLENSEINEIEVSTFWGHQKIKLKKNIEQVVSAISSNEVSNNLNSQKLLLKCGFILEGKKKKQVIYQKKRIDVYIYGILKNEY